eukprot:COSAG01_NODE_9844_length_2323_cov_2.845324_1_plen_256_part_00
MAEWDAMQQDGQHKEDVATNVGGLLLQLDAAQQDGKHQEAELEALLAMDEELRGILYGSTTQEGGEEKTRALSDSNRASLEAMLSETQDMIENLMVLGGIYAPSLDYEAEAEAAELPQVDPWLGCMDLLEVTATEPEPEPEVAGGDNEAPSPWRQIKTNDGRFYYWNTATNDTTLDDPADGFSLYAQQYYWPEPEPQPEPEPEPDDEVWDLDERGMAGMYTPDSRWMEFLPDEEWERDRPACFNESPMYFDGEQW